MKQKSNLNRHFKACMANCQHHDLNIRLLIDESRDLSATSDELADACNTICCLCHSYID